MIMPKLINYNTGLAWNREDGYSDFCLCCGSSFIDKPNEKTRLVNRKGIAMALTKINGRNSKKTSFNVIETKNGPISVSIRKEPY